MSMHQVNERRLRRSYDRNLGFAKFWGGAALGVLAAIFAFLSQPYNGGEYASPLALEILRALLGFAAGGSIGLAGGFWILYRRDDAELARIEQEG